MSHKVTFVNKDGSAGSASLPTLALANAYVRTVKHGVVQPGGTDDSFTVTKCGSRDEEEAKRAQARSAESREREAEAYTEAGIQARLTGSSVSEALDTALEAARTTRQSSRPEQNVCGCGKPCGSYTACYTCRRYR